MTNASRITTPRQAVEAMVEAGAHFTVRQRADSLGLSFTYRIRSGGNIGQCREILAVVKSKPAPFFDAFRAAVQDAASIEKRGAA